MCIRDSHNISRGLSITGGNPTLQVSKATIMIYTQPMILLPWAKFYKEGCHAVTPSSRVIPSQSLDPRLKNRSRLFYTLGEMEAKLVDPDAQSIMLDIHGNVAENKGGNIFIVRDGKLITPTTANCLEGLTRATTIEVAKSLNIEVVEAVIQPYDLSTADELFMTSTPYSIMPATKYNGLTIADGKVVPDSFEESRFLDADIIYIIKHCEVDVLDEFSSATPDQRNCRITATTKEGEKITAHRIVTLEEIKKGMPKEQIVEKFKENTERFYKSNQQDKIVDTIMDIDNNSNLKSFSEIFKFDQT